MDRKVKSFRLRVDLLDRLKAYASERGSTEVSVMEGALGSFFDDSERGVPDLPRPEAPETAAEYAEALVRHKSGPLPVAPPSLMASRQSRLNKEMGWDR